MKLTKGSQSTSEVPAILLQLCDPEQLSWDMQSMRLAIAQRAFELFEWRNREHGHDSEDWFRAESELLRPVSIMIHETPEKVSLHANVFGFTETELRVSVEPNRVAILGRKAAAAEAGEKVEYADWYPNHILRLIDLPVEIDPDGAVVELEGGMLKFELPKATTGRKENPTAKV